MFPTLNPFIALEVLFYTFPTLASNPILIAALIFIPNPTGLLHTHLVLHFKVHVAFKQFLICAVISLGAALLASLHASEVPTSVIWAGLTK